MTQVNCNECERLSKKSGKCLVLTSKTKRCWAFTTDKDWARKIKRAVALYKIGIRGDKKC